MIQLADKFHCTGCSACAQTCAHQAIVMTPDQEGFLQPVINVDKCVECGLCMKKCPALSPLVKESLSHQKSYAVISYSDRNISSSGGAFSVFARYVLSQGGVVYGATMDDSLKVRHIGIFSLDDLSKLRGSKYVQSEIGDTYVDAKNQLKQGKMVLYTGTPCQIAGLYKFLGKSYQNQLITLDLVCHGVPSPLVFETYLRKLKKSTAHGAEKENMCGFRFRKLDSWSIVPAVKFAESKWRILTDEKNAYMVAFFKGWTYRECCFNCQYSNMSRVGTFTIADFWGIGKHGVPFAKGVASGVSLVIDNTNSMAAMRQALSELTYIEERPLEEGVHENHNLKAPVARPEQRASAIKDLLDEQMSLADFARKYKFLPKKNAKYYLKKWTKDIIYALGIYNVYKSISYKIQ